MKSERSQKWMLTDLFWWKLLKKDNYLVIQLLEEVNTESVFYLEPFYCMLFRNVFHKMIFQDLVSHSVVTSRDAEDRTSL